MISTIMTASGLSALTDTTLPAEMVTIAPDLNREKQRITV